MKSSKKSTLNTWLIISCGVVALIAVAFIASTFGYSLRGATYNPVISMTPPTPTPKPTPDCNKFTQAQITSIVDRINMIQGQIGDINKQIDGINQGQGNLSTQLSKLEAQFNKVTDKNTKQFLLVQIKGVMSSMRANNENMFHLQQQIQRLQEEQNQLFDELRSGCVGFA